MSIAQATAHRSRAKSPVVNLQKGFAKFAKHPDQTLALIKYGTILGFGAFGATLGADLRAAPKEQHAMDRQRVLLCCSWRFVTTAENAYWLPARVQCWQIALLCQLLQLQPHLSCSVLSSCAVAWVASLPHPPPHHQQSRHPPRCPLLMTQRCQWCRHLALLLN
jgi:hypothetical protein